MREKPIWIEHKEKRISDAMKELLNAIAEFSHRQAKEHDLTLEGTIRVQHEVLLGIIEGLVRMNRSKLECGIRAVMEKVEKEAEAKTEDADSYAG